MPTTIAATAVFGLTVQETITEAPDAAPLEVVHTGFNATYYMTATSTPAGVLEASFNAALVAGALTLDLTNMTGTGGVTVNGTGYAVQSVNIQAPAANGAGIIITPSVSNGYNLFGASSSVTLLPGEQVLLYTDGKTPTIGASHKGITLAGTGTDSLNICLVMG